jgi:hypothetical protein
MSSEDMSELEKLWATEFLLVVGAGVLLWVVIAIVAAVVAPDDRPWSFFWCTLLLLGPLGIVLALIAPARPE